MTAPYNASQPTAYVHHALPISAQYPCLLPGVGIGTVIARTTLGGLPMSLDVRIGGEVWRQCAPCDVLRVPANVLAFPTRAGITGNVP